jgi:D-amino peptidase
VRVYLQFDIEGIAGFVQRDNRDLDDGRILEWRMRMRRIATREVSAAAEGCFRGGADSVVVWDSHGAGQSLLIEEIHPDVELISGEYQKAAWLPFFDDVDAGIYVGAHAMTGTPRAVVPHTCIRLNGRDYGEGGMFVVETGSRGIPVLLVSGDRAAVEEVRSLTPTSEFVVTKEALGPTLAKSLTPARTERLIGEAAERGLRRIREIEPYRIGPPFTFVWEGKGMRQETSGDDLVETYRLFLARFYNSALGWPEYSLREDPPGS